ncbi:MAG: VOC family protein [Actinobacteria bacterium]|nr:VOC family protein [Actinomycetota bacterium]MBU1944439.1 VOC family protein [Actinomycetota bacterium]MBU2688225.1 VOC family protein [Actinomycetota bacterium]
MIDAFQHIGIGVTDIERSMDFYGRILGFRIKLNDHEEPFEQMVSIIGSLCRMRVIMAANIRGGAAVELVQHTDSTPIPMPADARWGDIGYLAAGLKAFRLEDVVHRASTLGLEFVTPVASAESPEGVWRWAYLKDPDGLLLEALETPDLRAKGGAPRLGGFTHAVIGVSDMERSIAFYRDVIGFDGVVFDTSETPEGMEAATGGAACRTVTLKRTMKPASAFPLDGGMVRLVQLADGGGKPLYEGRRWGDVGIMEMAMDVRDVVGTYRNAVELGASEFCGPTLMDMGMGSVGSFAYVKDPDGNIVELVETRKLGYLPPSVVSPLLKGLLAVTSRR